MTELIALLTERIALLEAALDQKTAECIAADEAQVQACEEADADIMVRGRLVDASILL